MADEIQVHVIRKADLAVGTSTPPLDDPDGLMPPSPRMRRMLLTNPLSRHDHDPVQVVVCVGSRVAGRLNLLVGELRLQGQPVPVLWGADLLVSTRDRGLGLGTKLVQAWAALTHTAVGCGANAAARKIYQRLGWNIFELPMAFVVGRSGPFAEHVLRSRRLARLAAPLANAALRISRRWSAPRPEREGLRIERVARMSAELDPLLARQRRPVVSHRSAAWVNWLLSCSGPQEQQDQGLYYVCSSRGDLLGYFMLHRQLMPRLSNRFDNVLLGMLKEWMVLDEQRLDETRLVSRALDALLEWGVDCAAVPVVSADLDGRLGHIGVFRGKVLATVWHADERSPLHAEAYRRPELWRTTAADGDGFFV